ncbi:transposase [bacterium]|nr:transposase [bacterium]
MAQTAQVLTVHHRSGNHHDSFEALEFICQCIENVRKTRPEAVIETRMDDAFFSEDIVAMLDENNVEYSISVPFERYTTIKCFIDERQRWNKISNMQSFFEKNMSLKSWKLPKHRFLFVRQRNAIQNKEPIQLDLLNPKDYNHQYKVIITNKSSKPARIIGYHEGRGTQEGLFAELKSQLLMNYILCNTWNGNKVYMLSAILAHNLTRELQMHHHKRDRATTTKRPSP